MDHREQMQKDAQVWQEKSVKLIQYIRYGVLAVGFLVVAVMFLTNLGFPREVKETLPAVVMTEDGQMMECTLELRGEVTKYPLKKDVFGKDDSVTVYANGKRILLVSLYGDHSSGFICTQNQKAVCLLSVQLDQILLETDLQSIFPEMESQSCLVYTNYDSFDIPGEYAELFTFLKTDP